MSARRTALAVGMLVAAAAPTAARPTVPPGAAWLHYRLSYEHRAAPDPPTPAGTGLALAGVELDGLLGRRLAYLVGVDLAAGATIPAGFAYQVALRPVGLAVRLGATGAVGVSVGVGASGAVGTLDDGVEFPAVLAVELPLGDRLRLIGRGRVVWLAAAPARRRRPGGGLGRRARRRDRRPGRPPLRRFRDPIRQRHAARDRLPRARGRAHGRRHAGLQRRPRASVSRRVARPRGGGRRG